MVAQMECFLTGFCLRMMSVHWIGSCQLKMGCWEKWSLQTGMHGNWFINEINRLLDMSIPQQNEIDDWTTTISKYWDVIAGLQVRHAYFADEINALQSTANNLFISWLDLVGFDGMPNYFHMLDAGHLWYYLCQWGNLLHLQNQGRETYTVWWLSHFAINTHKRVAFCKWVTTK